MTNTLYTGDNLYILHGMNSASVDLIYLDPPFNSKRTYSAPIGSKSAGASFKDMWTWADVNEAYLEKLVDTYPALVRFIESIGVLHSAAMMAYVTYMTQRLLELHRILKPTGSLYLHVDPTASHYLKLVLDRIFGKRNFRNEIIWRRMRGAKGSQHKARRYGTSNDNLLLYTKSREVYFNLESVLIKLTEKERIKKFPFQDKDGRRYYDDSSHIWRSPSMGARPNLCYEWRGFYNPHPSGWRLSKEKLEQEYQKGNIVIRESGRLERRKYEDSYKGKSVDNIWLDIPIASGKERTGYPTQKPLALLERIIKASSKEGDLVLDPFCGCATTCVKAQHLNRKWIGIDIERQAADLLVQRLSDDAGLFRDFIHTSQIPQRTDIEKTLPSKSVKERLYKTQAGKCNGCFEAFNLFNLEIDHIIPKSKGGGDYYENYQLLCGNCNRIKGNRPMEYLRAKIKIRQALLDQQITFGT